MISHRRVSERNSRIVRQVPALYAVISSTLFRASGSIKTSALSSRPNSCVNEKDAGSLIEGIQELGRLDHDQGKLSKKAPRAITIGRRAYFINVDPDHIVKPKPTTSPEG